jgi:uncharacterized protein YqfB (UPF0267 family)
MPDRSQAMYTRAQALTVGHVEDTLARFCNATLHINGVDALHLAAIHLLVALQQACGLPDRNVPQIMAGEYPEDCTGT